MPRWERDDFERMCEAKAKAAYIGNGESWCVVLGNQRMLVPTRDRSLAPHLLLLGYWESWVTCALAGLVQPGAICIDGGANLGYFSLLMSMVAGPTGRVIAVEANPEMAHYCRESVQVNGRGGMICVRELALWDTVGERLTLSIPGDELGGAYCIGDVAERPDSHASIEVETTTIDELVRHHELPRVDVIKIDVEGAEPRVLEGMRETAEANPRLKVLMEYAPGVSTIGPELYDQAVAMGFDVMLVGIDGRMKPMKREQLPGGHSVNMLYLSRSAV